MDEFEFRQLLELFPVLRSRDYCAANDSSRQLTPSANNDVLVKEQSDVEIGNENHEAFWGKLKLAAERKVGIAGAEDFCRTFQQVYNKLVKEDLTLDAARIFLNARASS